MAKCKQCGHKYGKDESSIIINLKRFCNYDCATLFAKANIAKGREVKRKEVKRSDRKRKENLKTAGDYIKEAQVAANRYIRARDKGKPCISCGVPYSNGFGGKFDCGHYRSRGSASHLRFNLLNMAGQCVTCNRYNSGNVVEYRKGLINKIGVERVELLEYDNETRKFTIDYLKRVKVIFNKRARWYERR